ncbi:MAG: cytochrome c-type biogenesis protein CcmH [Methylophaga sp.]|nr:cytochrome c-type biogenesis protein CcmH [Methylophaga sp.]
MMKKWLGVIFLMLSSIQLQAAIEIYQFEQAEHEQLYKQMIDELRCLVCQNQNLSASNAALAKDLRQQTYEMVTNGKSHAQIVDYMTQRYGDFVLYRPPVKSSTALLWFGPFILLFAGLMVLIITLKNRKQIIDEPLSEQQKTQLKQLLDEDDK